MITKHPTQAPRLLAAAAFLLALFIAAGAWAQTDAWIHSGDKLILPFLSVSSPTGRFSESDPTKLKPGHKTGLSFGGDAGILVSEFLALGAGFDYVRFNQDFSQFPTEPPLKSAKTVIPVGGLWARLFLPGGYARWQPYGVLGFGFGRVKSDVQYTEPQSRQAVSADGEVQVIPTMREEITINTAVSVVGGLGVVIPASSRLGFCLEPRYRSVSTKGTDLKVKLTSDEGQTFESQYGSSDTGGITRLKSKSNTAWWEIRGGIVLTIR